MQACTLSSNPADEQGSKAWECKAAACIPLMCHPTSQQQSTAGVQVPTGPSAPTSAALGAVWQGAARVAHVTRLVCRVDASYVVVSIALQVPVLVAGGKMPGPCSSSI